MTKLIPSIQKIEKTKETYEINDLCELIITKENGKTVSKSWLNKSGIQSGQMYYMNKEQLIECINLMGDSSDFYNPADKYKLDNQLDFLISGKSLIENFYFYCSHNWMLFDYLGNAVSLPYFFDYCGSLKEKKANCEIFSEIINKLVDSTYIKEITLGEIPYYNSDFSGQIGIKNCKVYLPNDVYNNLYKLKKYNLHDLLKFNLIGKDTPDIYGILDLLIQYNNEEQYYTE